MLGRLFELVNRTKNLNVNKTVFFVLQDKTIQKFIIDLNRIEQLAYKGELPDGSFLPEYRVDYNNVYSFEGKSILKRKGEPYSLLDTGDFYRSFSLIVESNGFTIVANDEKENSTLEDMYAKGNKILGLTDENKTVLAETILPNIRDFVLNYLLQ